MISPVEVAWTPWRPKRSSAASRSPVRASDSMPKGPVARVGPRAVARTRFGSVEFPVLEDDMQLPGWV
jgi:hypothetical protein